MLKEFVKAWDENKNELLRYWYKNEPSNYNEIVLALIKKVLNPYFKRYEFPEISDNVTVIDDGDYQGTELFIFPKKTYQPDVDDYFFTYAYYGSCSACDTLEHIKFDLPTVGYRAKEYNTLALHLLQRIKKLNGGKE